jgi:Protein of unknown function (DUF1168)
MSEPIPESIPTSVSHPSHRPSKKLRPSPSARNPNATALSLQASQISNLMSNPDTPISMPPPANTTNPKQPSYTPPEIVANVQGSSAGAGSGEFHVYKASRRREYERIRGMEEEAKREKEDEEWERRERERRERDERERERNRAKRLKKKEMKKKQQKNNGEVQGAGEGGVEREDAKEKNGNNGALPMSERQVDGTADDRGIRNDAVGGSGAEASNEAQDEIGVVIHDDDG